MIVGVVGTGYWGKKVISEYINLKKEDIIEELLVFDKNIDAIPKSEHFKIRTSMESIIKDSNAIHICSPNSSHYEIARAAINSGKHVLIEKPMTINYRESKELVLLAKDKGVVLRVGHIFRFSNNINKLRSLISLGILGQIQYSLFTWGHLFPSYSTNEAGVLWDILPHPLDILLYITNESPKVVEEVTVPNENKSSKKFSMIKAMFNSDHISYIFVSGIHAPKTRKIEIIGKNGALYTEALSNKIVFESLSNNNEKKVYYVKNNNTILDEIGEFINDSKNYIENSRNSGRVGSEVVAMLERVANQ